MKANKGEEYMTVGDYCKVYDMLTCTREEFLSSYSYIDDSSYKKSLQVAMNPNYMADLMRQAENLLILESNDDKERFEHMNEVGTDYISAELWKSAIADFVYRYYTPSKKKEFEEIYYSMAC